MAPGSNAVNRSIGHYPLSVLELIPKEKLATPGESWQFEPPRPPNIIKRTIVFSTFPSFLHKVDIASIMCVKIEK